MPHSVFIGCIAPEETNMTVNGTVGFEKEDISLFGFTAGKHVCHGIENVHFGSMFNGVSVPAPCVDVRTAPGTSQPRRIRIRRTDGVKIANASGHAVRMHVEMLKPYEYGVPT